MLHWCVAISILALLLSPCTVVQASRVLITLCLALSSRWLSSAVDLNLHSQHQHQHRFRAAALALQVRSTAHNIGEAGRQTWSTARQGVTRPSSLLSIFSRSKPDEEWGGSGNDSSNADQRRQLLRVSNDQESNGAQQSPGTTDDKS